MTTDTNKAIVRRTIEEIVNNHRYDLVDEFFADTVEFHGVGAWIEGRAALVAFYAAIFSAFPDWHTTINEMIAEGDKVVVRITSEGTNLGDYQAIPATGKPYIQKAIAIYRLANGKIAEGWLQTDMLSMMQQLGLMPAPQS